jgi:predicted transcriptional regulator
MCYTWRMTKLLEEAIQRLRQLPEPMQDSAARALMRQLEEEPEPGDFEAIAEGRRDFERGDFVTLEQWRHEMGLTDR